MKAKSYAHQITALAQSKDREYFALLLEMGLGKSRVVIETICHLYEQGQITGALIIAPNGVVPVWVNEQLPLWLSVLATIVRWSPVRTLKFASVLQTVMDPRPTPLRILVINIEALSSSRGVRVAEEFLSVGPALMAIDESTTIKSGSAARTKAVLRLGRLAPYRRILTGMPVTQSPLDLYAQCQFLKPGLLGHKSFYSFRGAYSNLVLTRMGSRSFQKVVGYRDLDRLSAKLREFSYRATKEECLDLPPKVFQTVEVELTSEQKAAYKSMRDKAVVAIEGADQQSTAVIAITQLLRLHQLVCGHLTTDSGEVVTFPSNRLNILLGLLEESQGKVIIWASYKRDVLAICARLGVMYGKESVVDYYGDTSQEDRVGNLARFQTDSDCRFFVGTPKTGGLGLTLTVASTVIYYSNGYSLQDRAQSEDRCHRISQIKSVTYIDLVCRGTIDEVILEALRSKKELADLITDGKWESFL